MFKMISLILEPIAGNDSVTAHTNPGEHSNLVALAQKAADRIKGK